MKLLFKAKQKYTVQRVILLELGLLVSKEV